jgi:hypothetical protein
MERGTRLTSHLVPRESRVARVGCELPANAMIRRNILTLTMQEPGTPMLKEKAIKMDYMIIIKANVCWTH